jgi:hypothetical protein
MIPRFRPIRMPRHRRGGRGKQGRTPFAGNRPCGCFAQKGSDPVFRARDFAWGDQFTIIPSLRDENQPASWGMWP